MTLLVALTNILLGCVYTAYGIITLVELNREWGRRGFSHFGGAWVFMAFTCGPHHLEHGLHVAFEGRAGGPLDLVTVLFGLPAGATWFLLRLEALTGGRGDRRVNGTPRWVAALPALSVAYLGVLVASAVYILRDGADFNPRLSPNLLLLVMYGLIGYYLARTQLAGRRETGGWSLSGLSLTFVFPTCGLMHAVFALYGSVGVYDLDAHGLLIDWLSVPSSVYFVWVIRSLYRGTLTDWNRGGHGALPEPVGVAA